MHLGGDTPQHPTFTSTSTETTITTTKKTKQNQQKKNHPDAAKKCSNQHVFCLFVGKKSFQETQCAPGSWKERCHRNQRPWRGTHWVTQGVPGNDCVSIYIYIVCTYLSIHYSYVFFVCYLHICITQNICIDISCMIPSIGMIYFCIVGYMMTSRMFIMMSCYLLCTWHSFHWWFL